MALHARIPERRSWELVRDDGPFVCECCKKKRLTLDHKSVQQNYYQPREPRGGGKGGKGGRSGKGGKKGGGSGSGGYNGGKTTDTPSSSSSGWRGKRRWEGQDSWSKRSRAPFVSMMPVLSTLYAFSFLPVVETLQTPLRTTLDSMEEPELGAGFVVSLSMLLLLLILILYSVLPLRTTQGRQASFSNQSYSQSGTSGFGSSAVRARRRKVVDYRSLNLKVSEACALEIDRLSRRLHGIMGIHSATGTTRSIHCRESEQYQCQIYYPSTAAGHYGPHICIPCAEEIELRQNNRCIEHAVQGQSGVAGFSQRAASARDPQLQHGLLCLETEDNQLVPSVMQYFMRAKRIVRPVRREDRRVLSSNVAGGNYLICPCCSVSKPAGPATVAFRNKRGNCDHWPCSTCLMLTPAPPNHPVRYRITCRCHLFGQPSLQSNVLVGDLQAIERSAKIRRVDGPSDPCQPPLCGERCDHCDHPRARCCYSLPHRDSVVRDHCCRGCLRQMLLNESSAMTAVLIRSPEDPCPPPLCGLDCGHCGRPPCCYPQGHREAERVLRPLL